MLMPLDTQTNYKPVEHLNVISVVKKESEHGILKKLIASIQILDIV